MFAVAVWDRDDRRGVLSATGSASSRSTTRIVGDVVVFGSELKCVIASGLVSDELDPEAIAAYLDARLRARPDDAARATSASSTPGERLVVEDGRVRLERWWRYPAPGADPVRAAPTSGPRRSSTSSRSPCGCG